MMRPTDLCRRCGLLATLVATAIGAVACGSDSTSPNPGTDSFQFTPAQLSSLDSITHAIETANPTDATIKALGDSVLTVITAGVQAKRVDVTTNLTTAPLYAVGIRRTIAYSTGFSWSTWNLTLMDDPSHLSSVIEVSGFAQNTTTTPPSSVSGTIGSSGGTVNALLLQVGNAGAVTKWFASSGTVSFSSDAPGAACPGFTATSKVTCAVETMHVHFTVTANDRQASVPSDVDIPTMHLTYTP